MNLIILCGNLTNDPEASQTSGGREVSKFSIAVNREYEDSDGNRGVDYFNCTAFGKQAENINKYFTKGRKILIRGHVKIDDVERDGNRRRFFNIIVDKFEFVQSKGSGQGEGDGREDDGRQAKPPAAPSTNDTFFDDDDVPF